jgi:hypothetical protein
MAADAEMLAARLHAAVGGQVGQMMIASVRRKFMLVKGIGAGKRFFLSRRSLASLLFCISPTRSCAGG